MTIDQGKLTIESVTPKVATAVVTKYHYLHRRPPISYTFGLLYSGQLMGVVTFGIPPSRHLQMGACPTDPNLVIELNRLWVDDCLPQNTESWFVSRALKLLPGRIVVSYADPVHNHVGVIYRALNFKYAGWTDMERKTPRYDYIPANPNTHTRDAYRNGYVEKRRRIAKVKYWITSGNRKERKTLLKLCAWPQYNWRTMPPKLPHMQASLLEAAA